MVKYYKELMELEEYYKKTKEDIIIRYIKDKYEDHFKKGFVFLDGSLIGEIKDYVNVKLVDGRVYETNIYTSDILDIIKNGEVNYER